MNHGGPVSSRPGLQLNIHIMRLFTRFSCLVVFLAAAVSAQQPAPVAGPAPGVSPEARAIVARHRAALGADDPSVTSMRATGTLAMPAQGISGTVEIIAARPNKTLLKATIPGIGSLESGFDGERGWSVDPIMGPALLTGAALEQAKFDAVFDGPFEDLSRFTSMTAGPLEVLSFGITPTRSSVPA